jgi:hypothetical protein
VLSRNKVGVPEGVAGANHFGSLMVEQLFYTQKVMGSSPIQKKFFRARIAFFF